ncbi:MAG: phosphate signaling complex protein PhoU [Actinobacteria bacterium]|nr:phosphate signaling complex protein PhoU [Actinomycetota bacterium]
MRNEFLGQKHDLVDRLVGTAEVADEMLGDAVRALADQDADLAAAVVSRDNEVDRRYVDTQDEIIRVISLQAPVAGDTRLLTSMLHVNIHLERMGDYATSVAKMARRSEGLKGKDELAAQIAEMAELAQRVGRESIRSYAQRDVELARQLPAMDDGVDRLNRGIFQRLVALVAEDESRLEWASNMILVPRLIERYGDHAVDIGEQTIFAVTGEAVELSSNDPEDR